MRSKNKPNKRLLLAVDVGNTNINMAVFSLDNLKPKETFVAPTFTQSYQKYLKKLSQAQEKFDACVICSVVPKNNVALAREIKKILKINPLLIGKDIDIPIKNCYRHPQQVGADRLVNTYAAVNLYGAPAVVVDLGTAVTFDVISTKKEYLGGMILPGLGLSLLALAEHTALLPHLTPRMPKEFIGRSTEESILSGVINGYALLIDAMLKRLRALIGKKSWMIATGGDARFIRSLSKQIKFHDPALTLKGICLIYKYHVRDENICKS